MPRPRTFRSSRVPRLRTEPCNASLVDSQGEFLLYWMRVNRRAGWNFSLDRAVEWAKELGKPLVVLEVLPCGCRWASDRHHHFVLQGMAENAKRFARSGV
jgi:deoxyribodipyrimidine photo-lyase